MLHSVHHEASFELLKTVFRQFFIFFIINGDPSDLGGVQISLSRLIVVLQSKLKIFCDQGVKYNTKKQVEHKKSQKCLINLLTIGLSSFSFKYKVPSDIGEHNQYIPPENLQSQKYNNEINIWTIKQKMKINESKTKTMIFNFTNNNQFNIRLNLNNSFLEISSGIREPPDCKTF